MLHTPQKPPPRGTTKYTTHQKKKDGVGGFGCTDEGLVGRVYYTATARVVLCCVVPQHVLTVF